MANIGIIEAASVDVLALDTAAEIERISSTIREQVGRKLRRRGAVLGVSGGIDSSVCLALCAKAFGAQGVLALLMPETDSDPESLRLGKLVAGHFGVTYVVEDIAPMLRGAGCYQRRNEFIRQVIPEFGDDWKCKIVLQGASTGSAYNVFKVVVPVAGAELSEREIIRHCAENLEDFMVPKSVEFRRELPMTGSGKIRRSEVQAEALGTTMTLAN